MFGAQLESSQILFPFFPSLLIVTAVGIPMSLSSVSHISDEPVRPVHSYGSNHFVIINATQKTHFKLRCLVSNIYMNIHVASTLSN